MGCHNQVILRSYPSHPALDSMRAPVTTQPFTLFLCLYQYRIMTPVLWLPLTLSSVHPHWSPVTLTEQTSHEITNHFWHSTCLPTDEPSVGGLACSLCSGPILILDNIENVLRDGPVCLRNSGQVTRRQPDTGSLGMGLSWVSATDR